MFTYEMWSPLAVTYVTLFSRTAKGVSEVSYSGKKESYSKDPEALISGVVENTAYQVDYLWKQKDSLFSTAKDMHAFIDHLYHTVNKGFSPTCSNMYRTWDTRGKFPMQIPPDDISSEYLNFVDSLTRLFKTDGLDPVLVAAWVEREINARIHPYFDGCGRMSRLLGAYVLLRGGLLPPVFRYKNRYHKELQKSLSEWEVFYRKNLPHK